MLNPWESRHILDLEIAAMGCDAAVQLPPSVPKLCEVEPAIMRSELIFQGKLTEEEALEMSEDELRERSQGLLFVMYSFIYEKVSMLIEKSPDLIRSDLVYQGVVSQEEAGRMSEEQLQECAQGLPVRLHHKRDYSCVDYYSLLNLSRDKRFQCYDNILPIALLTGVEFEYWNPEWLRVFYHEPKIVIKGFTQDSVDRAKAELDRLKESQVGVQE